MKSNKKSIITLAVSGLLAVAMMGCGNAASNQPEEKSEKSVTEVPADSIMIDLPTRKT